jgi:hypothetical protein
MRLPVKEFRRTMNRFFDILTVAVPLAIGVAFLAGADRIQDWAVKLRERENVKLFDGYVKSKSYLVTIRIIGAACVLVGFLLLFVVVRR